MTEEDAGKTTVVVWHEDGTVKRYDNVPVLPGENTSFADLGEKYGAVEIQPGGERKFKKWGGLREVWAHVALEGYPHTIPANTVTARDGSRKIRGSFLRVGEWQGEINAKTLRTGVRSIIGRQLRASDFFGASTETLLMASIAAAAIAALLAFLAMLNAGSAGSAATQAQAGAEQTLAQMRALHDEFVRLNATRIITGGG